ncbi:MAG: hypothetical protein KU28_11715, partial [Sulfurovum sp. PC08-66]
MKIKQIKLKKYKQFKDLTLDLTYPKGHKKEGQPLDKICIIGQSGTGKTNLLRIIRDKMYAEAVQTNFIEEEKSNSEKIYIYNLVDDHILDGLFPEYLVPIDFRAWLVLQNKINNYNKERLSYLDILSRKILTLDDYTKDDYRRETQEWEEKNDNILDKIADKLNPLLHKFNIELMETNKQISCFIDLTIKDLSNENIIKYKNLSTGTKNLIATFIPLKIHNPKDSIILIDEPENSFYPDIQRKL